MKVSKIIGLFLIAGSFLTDLNAQAQKPELITQTGHNSQVNWVAFSPDGTILASAGGFDNTIKLWDVASGQELRTLRGHTGQHVDSVAFLPNGKFLISVGGSVKVWDVATGKETQSFGDGVSLLTNSPDGRKFASVDVGDKTIKVFDVASKKNQVLVGHTGLVMALAFSPDGKFLVSGSRDKTLRLWETTTGSELQVLQGHTDGVNAAAFSPDGKTIASGSDDNSVILWSVESGKQLNKLATGQIGPVNSVSFSPDGRTLAAGSDYYPYVNGKSTVVLWDVASGRELRSLAGHNETVRSVVFSPDGQTIASGGNKIIRLADSTSGASVRSFVGRTDFPSAHAISPDGEMLASTMGKTVKLWNLASGQELRTLTAEHGFNVNLVAFSPDSKTLLTGTWISIAGGEDDKTIELWDTGTGQRINSTANINTHSVAFSPDGKTFVLGGPNGGIRMLDTASCKEIKKFTGHTGDVLSLAFSRDGKTLASGGNDDTIRMWDVVSGREIQSIRDLKGDVHSVVFSADGKTLGSEFTYEIKFWDVATGKETRSFPKNDTAKATREVLAAMPDFYLRNKYVPITPDGRFQVAVGQNGKLDFYKTETGDLIASLMALDESDWAAVTPDGLFDGTPGAWKTLMWRLDNNTFKHAPVEAFFNEFFRPGLLQDILANRAIEKPSRDISTIDIRQPNVKVHLAETEKKAAEVTERRVTVNVDVTDAPSDQQRSATSGAKDLRLFRNGSLVKVWKGDAFALTAEEGCKQTAATTTSPRKAVCSTELPITAGDNSFTAYAFNNDNVKSLDSELTVKGADSLRRPGTMYVLAVGINEYTNSAFNLRYAVPDVVEVGKEISLEQSKLSSKQYAETKVISLTNEQATKANIVAALKKFAGAAAAADASTSASPELAKIAQIQPEDALVIYFAGHGLANKERFYLIPHDGIPAKFAGVADPAKQKRLLMQGESLSDQRGLQQLFKQSISDLELEDLLETVNAGKLVMVIDACNSGQALEAEEKRRGPMNSRGLAQLAYEKGMNILTASQGYQAALEASKLNHGLLSFALLEGMTKGDANNDRSVTDREWLDYGVVAVPRLQAASLGQRLLQQGKSPAQKAGPQEALQTPRVFYRREADARPLILHGANNK